jgi:hypothetical protein
MLVGMLAMLCLVLLCLVSTAQVCHVHGELAPTGKESRQSVPDRCPLCVAMHSALPAAAHTTPEPVLQVQGVPLKTVEVPRVQRWGDALFSRPPPVASLQAQLKAGARKFQPSS